MTMPELVLVYRSLWAFTARSPRSFFLSTGSASLRYPRTTPATRGEDALLWARPLCLRRFRLSHRRPGLLLRRPRCGRHGFVGGRGAGVARSASRSGGTADGSAA